MGGEKGKDNQDHFEELDIEIYYYSIVIVALLQRGRLDEWN